jgi:hypothetical protein
MAFSTASDSMRIKVLHRHGRSYKDEMVRTSITYGGLTYKEQVSRGHAI